MFTCQMYIILNVKFKTQKVVAMDQMESNAPNRMLTNKIDER